MNDFPPLKIKKRERAIYEVGKENIYEIIYSYLVLGFSYRKIDREILQFSQDTRGWESMGVMHHFGFTKAHKGFCKGVPEEKMIDFFKEHIPDIIPYISNMGKEEIQKGVHEGEKRLAIHIRRERNYKIISAAKELFKKKHHGRIYCEICGFDFYDMYGKHGEGFIEGHHKKPISQMNIHDTTAIDDIVMVCSNCHSMLHRKPFLSVEDLKSLLLFRKKNNSGN